jgi:hypothetical protein
MKRGIGKRLLWTGVASPLLMAFVFPNGASSAKVPPFVWAALGINFLLTWFTLLVAVLLIGKLISLLRKRRAQG